MATKPIDNNLDLQGFKLLNAKQESFNPGSLIVSGATTLDATHHTVILNAATSATTAPFTLPSPTGCQGRVYALAARQGIISLAVTGGSTIFDETAGLASIPHSGQTIVQSDGTNWRTLIPTKYKQLTSATIAAAGTAGRSFVIATITVPGGVHPGDSFTASLNNGTFLPANTFLTCCPSSTTQVQVRYHVVHNVVTALAAASVAVTLNK